MIALFDANIVMDCLKGIPRAAAELAPYQPACISPITGIKAQIKTPPDQVEATRQAIDANVKRIELGEATRLERLNLRRSHRLNLPDALIEASARIHGWQLVARHSRDFPPQWAAIGLP